jgi:hypothetical protein
MLGRRSGVLAKPGPAMTMMTMNYRAGRDAGEPAAMSRYININTQRHRILMIRRNACGMRSLKPSSTPTAPCVDCVRHNDCSLRRGDSLRRGEWSRVEGSAVDGAAFPLAERMAMRMTHPACPRL